MVCQVSCKSCYHNMLLNPYFIIRIIEVINSILEAPKDEYRQVQKKPKMCVMREVYLGVETFDNLIEKQN